MVNIGDIWEIELTIGKITWLVLGKVYHQNNKFDDNPNTMKWDLQEVSGSRSICLHDKHIIQYGKKIV